MDDADLGQEGRQDRQVRQFILRGPRQAECETDGRARHVIECRQYHLHFAGERRDGVLELIVKRERGRIDEPGRGVLLGELLELGGGCIVSRLISANRRLVVVHAILGSQAGDLGRDAGLPFLRGLLDQLGVRAGRAHIRPRIGQSPLGDVSRPEIGLAFQPLLDEGQLPFHGDGFAELRRSIQLAEVRDPR